MCIISGDPGETRRIATPTPQTHKDRQETQETQREEKQEETPEKNTNVISFDVSCRRVLSFKVVWMLIIIRCSLLECCIDLIPINKRLTFAVWFDFGIKTTQLGLGNV